MARTQFQAIVPLFLVLVALAEAASHGQTTTGLAGVQFWQGTTHCDMDHGAMGNDTFPSPDGTWPIKPGKDNCVVDALTLAHVYDWEPDCGLSWAFLFPMCLSTGEPDCPYTTSCEDLDGSYTPGPENTVAFSPDEAKKLLNGECAKSTQNAFYPDMTTTTRFYGDFTNEMGTCTPAPTLTYFAGSRHCDMEHPADFVVKQYFVGQSDIKTGRENCLLGSLGIAYSSAWDESDCSLALSYFVPACYGQADCVGFTDCSAIGALEANVNNTLVYDKEEAEKLLNGECAVARSHPSTSNGDTAMIAVGDWKNELGTCTVAVATTSSAFKQSTLLLSAAFFFALTLW